MYSNNKLDYCYCNDFSNVNGCCSISTPFYVPSVCCCCTPRAKKLSKPIIRVPEMKPSFESLSNKSSAKAKKKMGKLKKGMADSLQSSDAIGKAQVLGSSFSETALRKATMSEGTNNSDLKRSASFGKQKFDVKRTAAKGQSQAGTDKRKQLHNRYNQDAANSSTALGGKSSNAADKINHHLVANGHDPLKCYCFCCSNESPTCVGPINLSKHSFANSKTSPQLDVICEEGTEVEKNQKLGEGQPQDKSSCGSTRSKKHKKLEDSCTEFLTIICDNILESVQKSVDSKLKEFSREASEKISILGQKMATNESAIKNVCSDVLEKFTEQNKSNFEAFYLRVQNLVQNQNQNRMNRGRREDALGGPLTTTSSGAPICEELKQQQVMSADPITGGPICHSELQPRNRTTPIDIERMQPRDVGSRTPAGQSSSMAYSHEACDLYNVTPSASCGCYHCEDVQFNHPCCPIRNASETAIHPCDNTRETGGCIKSEELSTALNPKEIELHEMSLKPPSNGTPTNSSISEKKFPSSAAHTQQSCSVETSSSAPITVTTFSLTPSHKTIFNCTCFTHYQDDGERLTVEANGSKKANDNGIDVNINCPIRYDSCDTSGYASDPEDGKNKTSSNNSCSKMLKSSSKISCIHQTSGSSVLELSHATVAADKMKANGSNQTIQKPVGSSLKTPSSRLFRL